MTNKIKESNITDGAVTSAKLDANAVTSAKLNYPLTTFSSTGIDDNASGNAITIESSKRVQFTRARSNTLGDSALEILPSDTVAGIGFRMENTNNDLVIEKSSPSGSEAEILRIRIGGGIALGGTGDANTLDDYEEGSWTPTITSSVTNPTITYDTWHHGNYTKIGDTVFARAFIRTDSVSGGSGDIYIKGFPFNFVAGTTGSVYPASVMITGMSGWSTTPSYAYNLYVDDRIQLYDSSGTPIPVSGLGTGSNANQMTIFVMYKV